MESLAKGSQIICSRSSDGRISAGGMLARNGIRTLLSSAAVESAEPGGNKTEQSINRTGEERGQTFNSKLLATYA